MLSRIIILAALWLNIPVFAEDIKIDTWVASPYQKIFIHTLPGENYIPHVVKNEYVALQIAVRFKPSSMGYDASTGFSGFKTIQGDISSLKIEEGNYTIPAERIRIRTVGDVTIRAPIPKEFEKELDGPSQRPYPFPDILWNSNELTNVIPNITRVFWISFTVPRNAPKGTYTAEFTALAKSMRINVPIKIIVHDVTLPDERKLYHSYQLWAFEHIEQAYFPDSRFSQNWWNLIEKIAANMGSHRYTCVTVQPVLLVQPEKKNETVQFDFSRFDRFVDLFKRQGIQWLHLYPIVDRKELWKFNKNQEDVAILIQEQNKNGEWRPIFVPVDDPRAKLFHSVFLPALEKHLEEKGWLNTCFMPIADEDDQQWIKEVRQLYKDKAPRLLATNEKIDWVHIWNNNEEKLEKAKKGAKNIMLYVTTPKSFYPKEVIEEPTLNHIIMQWLCFRWNLSGYGFWAYNQGWISPVDIFSEPSGGLDTRTFPLTGNTFIVYPGKEGPLDSIRHEANLNGIEDVELLYLLEKKDKKRADEYCTRMIPEMNKGKFVRNIQEYENIRKDLIEAIEDLYR